MYVNAGILPKNSLEQQHSRVQKESSGEIYQYKYPMSNSRDKLVRQLTYLDDEVDDI